MRSATICLINQFESLYWHCRPAWHALRLAPPGGVLVEGPRGAGAAEVAQLLGSCLATASDCLTHVVHVDCSEIDSGSLQRVQRHMQPLVCLACHRTRV